MTKFDEIFESEKESIQETEIVLAVNSGKPPSTTDQGWAEDAPQ